MTNNKLVLKSFNAFAMTTMAATMIATQETYAATITYGIPNTYYKCTFYFSKIPFVGSSNSGDMIVL
jgi:hypothetical protein